MNINQRFSTGAGLRKSVRSGQFDGQTAGQAPDFLQGNLVILPKAYAQDFLIYCQNNPKACPIIGITKPGQACMPELGTIDLRTDVPKYRIYRDGIWCDELTDISALWTDDLVGFVLGCSFTFEDALMRRGFKVRHIEEGKNVPMYRTELETIPGGIFSGPLVVSMRSFKEHDIPDVFASCFQYPHAHGTPIYWGDASKIGIKDLSAPDYGDAVDIPQDEVPVFWACGVTPQTAIERAKPSMCITHAPGCMLVTDVPSASPPMVDGTLAISSDQLIKMLKI